jgi:hypothetical protein
LLTLETIEVGVTSNNIKNAFWTLRANMGALQMKTLLPSGFALYVVAI